MAMNREDKLVIASLVVMSAGVTLAAKRAQPDILAITVFLTIGVLIVGAAAMRSERLCWLLLFGLVAGFGELWADWVHVEHFKSLVYTDYFGYRLLASPLYMPFGWALTVAQFGYFALRLRERWSARTAII